ncbi:hypothetical protein TYRP_015798 [Tyrophagus putrescentiae]|nr:hypothetical protein TYRP_015798 [Tyrophagus putrescentiae]
MYTHNCNLYNTITVQKMSKSVSLVSIGMPGLLHLLHVLAKVRAIVGGVVEATLQKEVLVVGFGPVVGVSLGVQPLGGALGDAQRHVVDVLQRRVDAALLQVAGRHLVGEGESRHQEDLVGNLVHLTGHHRQRHAGEDVGVVALAGQVRLPLDRHRGEGRPTGEDAPALGRLVRLLGGALRLGGRVGEGEDERLLYYQ